MFLRCLILLTFVLPVVGCASPDTIGPVSYRPYDKGFEKLTVRWSGRYTGAETNVYLRRKQSGSNLGLCGFYIGSSGIQQGLTAEWLRVAKVVIDEKEIVSGKFILLQDNLRDAKAACVETTTPYHPRLLTQKMYLKGRKVTLYY